MPRAPRRRTRIAYIAALCLLLGVTTTVGVAWEPSWATQFHPYGQSRSRAWYVPPVEYKGSEAAAAGWPAPVPLDWPPPNMVQRLRQREWENVTAALIPGSTPQRPTHFVMVERRGLPFLAVQREEVTGPGLAVPDPPPAPGWDFVSWRTGLRCRSPIPAGGTLTTWYPCLPVWPGFAADTALYATAWWLLIVAPLPLYRTARRHLRVSRGMCGACGYNLQGSPKRTCPECGPPPGASA